MWLCPNDKACSILKAAEVLSTVKTPPRIMAGKPDERSFSRGHLRQSRPSLANRPRNDIGRIATDMNGRNGNIEVFRAEEPTQVGPAEGNTGSPAAVPLMAGMPRRRMPRRHVILDCPQFWGRL